MNQQNQTRNQQGSKSQGGSSQMHYKDNWQQIQQQARQRWSDLSQADLSQAEGSREYLVSAVQDQCGISRAQAEQQVDDFERDFQSRQSQSATQRSGSQSNA